MKMKAAVLFAFFALTLGLAVFSSNPVLAAPAGKALKVGVLTPLSGPAVSWGQHTLMGAEIARDEINAAGGVGGVPMKLVVYDTSSKPDQAIALAKKLAEDDEVLLIVGPVLSSACEVAYPVTNRMKIVAVSPVSAKPGISAKNRPWAFRNNLTSDKTLGPAIVKWVKNNHIKTAAIIYDNSDAVSTGEGAKVYPAFLKKTGVKLLDTVTVQKKDIDFSAHVTRLKGQKPDGILIAAQAEQAANIVREVRRQGLNIPVMTGVECANPLFIRQGKSAVEGVYTASATWADNPDPKVKAFVAEFMKRKNNEKPNSGAFKAYDTIYIIKGIVLDKGVSNDPKQLSQDRDKIRQGWAGLKDFPGIAGVTSINQEGDGVSLPTILVVKDGQWTAVK